MYAAKDKRFDVQTGNIYMVDGRKCIVVGHAKRLLTSEPLWRMRWLGDDYVFSLPQSRLSDLQPLKG